MSSGIETQTTSAKAVANAQLSMDTVLQYVKLSDLAPTIGGATLDPCKLIALATAMIPDIVHTMTWDGQYKSLDFMKKMLFEIGPETRTVKKGKDSDKHWIMRCTTDEMDKESTNTCLNFNYAGISGEIDVEKPKMT